MFNIYTFMILFFVVLFLMYCYIFVSLFCLFLCFIIIIHFTFQSLSPSQFPSPIPSFLLLWESGGPLGYPHHGTSGVCRARHFFCLWYSGGKFTNLMNSIFVFWDLSHGWDSFDSLHNHDSPLCVQKIFPSLLLYLTFSQPFPHALFGFHLICL